MRQGTRVEADNKFTEEGVEVNLGGEKNIKGKYISSEMVRSSGEI